jgi:hypothetical protein
MEEGKEVNLKEKELKSEKHRMIIQVAFLIILILAISALVGAIVTIHRYADVLTNPVGYNLAQFNISTCTCMDDFGKLVQINAIDYSGEPFQIDTPNYAPQNKINFINFSS